MRSVERNAERRPESLGSNIVSGIPEYSSPELYLYVGSSVNVNIYNSFLQGQFRSSQVEADSGDVVPV